MPCTFCNLPGHNITTCNDILIDIHYDRMKKIYMNILTQIYPHNIENFTEIGKSILNRRFDLKILRVIGVQYLWVSTRMTKAQLIPLIWDYFKTRIYYPPLLENQQPPEVIIDTIIDRSARPPLIRYHGNEVIMSMMPHYRHDVEVLNRELRRYNIIIRNFDVEFHPELNGVVEAEVVEPVDKRYNIIPILVLKDEDEKVDDCPICYENIKCVDLITLNCSHQFCGVCITNILEKHNNTTNPTCPLCRTFMYNFDIKNTEIYNLVEKYCR